MDKKWMVSVLHNGVFQIGVVISNQLPSKDVAKKALGFVGRQCWITEVTPKKAVKL